MTLTLGTHEPAQESSFCSRLLSNISFLILSSYNVLQLEVCVVKNLQRVWSLR